MARAETNGGSLKKQSEATSPLQRLMRRRRSTSAPPTTGRRLIEEHYRVDSTHAQTVVLPGAPKHEDDWARDAHDFFNLVVLIPVVVLNIMNWNWDMLLNMPPNKAPEDAWTGEWFNVFYFYCMTYFVADFLWVVILPGCVRSPATIIQHHTASILYMLIPWYFAEFRFIMGALMSVELNTWFLIARRVFNKQGFPPWTIDLPPILSIRIKLISICFYFTWITIRCVIYPLLFVEFFTRYNSRTALLGTRFNIWAVIIPIHTCFVMLNFKWTYDLVMSKLRYWRRKGQGKKEEISKGL